jgi:poly(ADP-ribose) glycohydrolase ARH3
MTTESLDLRDRFRGCLLGLACGDALGGLFEGQLAEHILERFPSTAALIGYPTEEIWYTDDTQMMIGIAETLVACGQMDEATLCRAFVENFTPNRGYGRGARRILMAMESGEDHAAVAESVFPGGSYGNGAAMRVAPLGLVFRQDPERLAEEVLRSSLPTHRHELGIDGARVIARAVAYAATHVEFDREAYFQALVECSTTTVFRKKLEAAAAVQSADDLIALGNGIEAHESVPAAIASFALAPQSYDEVIAQVIFLGGDTDTMAAMAGAISGAFLGASRLPSHLLDQLESSPKGRGYIESLADALFARD